jgi:hypothetical protein
MRAAILALVLLAAACGDEPAWNKVSDAGADDDDDDADAGSTPTPSLTSPAELASPPAGTLMTDLLPPGFGE